MDTDKIVSVSRQWLPIRTLEIETGDDSDLLITFSCESIWARMAIQIDDVRYKPVVNLNAMWYPTAGMFLVTNLSGGKHIINLCLKPVNRQRHAQAQYIMMFVKEI